MKRFFLLATAALCPFFARSQQKNLSLDEVVVTANKFDEKASQTGKVVTVIDQKDIAHSRGKTLGVLLDEQAGITVNGSSEAPGTNQTIYMRGADPKYTLILIDGIPVNDVSYNDYKFDLNLIPLSAIERIEIIRGGYATLYGSGTASGVINIITKKGGQRPLNVTAGFSGGSYGTFREQAGFNGHKNKIDYSLQMQQMDSKGFSSALDSTGHGGYDRDGFHRQAVYGNMGFHPGDNWTLRPFINFTYEKGDLDYGAFTDDPDDRYNTTFLQTGLDIQHSFANGDLHLKYSFNPTTRHYLNDSLDGSDYSREKYQSIVHDVDAYTHVIVNPHISFLLGNSIRFEKTSQQYRSFSGGYPYNTDLSGDSAQTDAMSVYGSLFLKTKNGFHLELGGRLNQHKLYGFHPVFSINPSWLITGKVKIFANVSSSFTSPSLYQLYSIYGNTRLKPETGLSYEGGMEALLAGQKLKLRLTGFDRDLRHVIAFQLTDPLTGAYQYVNYDHQREYGGEAELNYELSDKLQLKGYYAYVTGRVTVRNDATKNDSTYNNLFKRPEHTVGLSLGYQLIPSLFLSVDGKYTGQRKDLVFMGNGSQAIKLKGYFLFNMYAQYVWKKKFTAHVGLYNITNSHYIETTGFSTRRFNFDTGIDWSLF